MARPERNIVDYYPHIVGEGKKMYFIDKKYKNDGYATWFKILDKLAVTEYHYLNLNKEEEVMFLASKCNITEKLLVDIITDLVKLGKFDKNLWEFKIIWDQSFVDSIQDAYKKRNNNCITLTGLRVLLTGLGVFNKPLNDVKVPVKPQTKVNYTKLKKTKLKVVDSAEPTLYQKLVDFWLMEFHIGWTFTAQQGKELKSTITKIKSVQKGAGKESSDESVFESFKQICLNLPEWYRDKDLAVINSKFNEIVSEIKNSKNGKSVARKEHSSTTYRS